MSFSEITYVNRGNATTLVSVDEYSMPQFHFNIYDGVNDPIPASSELPSWQDARLVAVRMAGLVIKDDAMQVIESDTWYMEVTDDRGFVLLHLAFTISESPAPLAGV